MAEDTNSTEQEVLPEWQRSEGVAELVAVPHSLRLQAGQPIHFDIFLWNRGAEEVWIYPVLTWGLSLWVDIKHESGNEVEFDRIKVKAPLPTSKDCFMQLPPNMAYGRPKVTYDRIVLTIPGRYTVHVHHERELARLCAACHGLALADVTPTFFDVIVE